MAIRTSIRQNKYYFIFLLSVLVIGIIAGIIIFLGQSDISKNAIQTDLSNLKDVIANIRQNQILFHIFIISALFMCSFTIIGILANIFYFFYEGAAIGFSLISFTYTFGAKGLLFGIIFNIVTKFIYLIIVLYIVLISIKIAKKFISSIIFKRDEITYRFIRRHFIILGIVLGINLLNDILIYFLGNMFLKLFLFLL